MFNWFKKAAKTVMEVSAEYFENQTFVEGLLTMPNALALQNLQMKVQGMDDRQYKAFYGALGAMIGTEYQKIQHLRSPGGSGYDWGNSYEDQLARAIAAIDSRPSPQQRWAIQQSGMKIQALQVIAMHADQFRKQISLSPHVAQTESSIRSSYDELDLQSSRQMDDTAKALWFMEIQQRHMAAMPKILPGTASDELIEEFKAIYDDYKKLLKMGPPVQPLYTLNDVRGRMADALDKIARTYDSMRNEEKAIYYYEQAAMAFDEINQSDNAAQSQHLIAQIKLNREGNIDEEIQRLQARLSTITENSLEYVKALVGLGELQMKGGDDFAAEEYITDALAKLEALGYPDPSDQDPKEILKQTLRDIKSGKANVGRTQIEMLLAVRSLYQRIYQSLSAIYQEQEETLEKAANCSRKYEQLIANELTREDIEQLLAGPANYTSVRNIR